MNIKLRKQYIGLGLIGWIVAIPVLLIGLVILAVIFYEGRKAYWDYRVTEMCKMDGGATVFENIRISQGEYKRLGGINGAIPVPAEQYKKDSPYFARTVTQEIREWNPEVKKWTTEIIRNTDEKVLGIEIIYMRIGGDTPTGILHPSSFSCRDVAGVKLGIERQIFIINGDTK